MRSTGEDVLTGWLIPAAVVLLPLACWPAMSRPFSTPKLWVLAGLDVLIAAAYLTRAKSARGLPPWPWLAWIAAVSLSAVTAPLLSPQAFVLLLLPLPLLAVAPDPRVLCAGSIVESAIAILQFAHRDPFAWFGWQPEAFASTRMRVYGTLGNPDFVAAWLAATLPLCLVLRGRAARAACLVLQLGALLCTGSRVILLALPAAALTLAIAGWRGEYGAPARSSARRWWWLLAVPVLFAVAWLSPTRSLAATVSGRLHYVRVAAAHLHEVPVTGLGPGAFEVKFAAWQDEWVRGHAEDARYQGPVDHAHNDYLEFWVEYGPLGLAAFLVLCGWLFFRRSGSRLSAPVLAALAALLAIACVDFPFHRPAGWALFVVLASHKEA